MSTINWLRWLRVRHFPLIVGVLIVMVTIIAVWLSSWNALYIDKNFSYSADLQTTLNTYDPATQHYQAPTYMVTSYSAQLITSDLSSALLKDSVSTLQPDGQSYQQTSQFWANAKNGRVYHDNTVSYVMGPRNIQKNQSFNYWYASQKKAVRMHYESTEKIFGLPVYSYTGKASSQTTDPLAPENDQKIQRNVQFRLWIEPTTGWLIKAQITDNDYQISASKKTPARYSSVNFTEATVRQHVSYAKQLKTKLNFGTQVAPSILLIGALLVISGLILALFRIRSVPVEIITAVVLAASIANMVGWALHITPLQLLLPGNVALNPLASACFMSLAICALLLYYHRGRQQKIALAIGISVAMITFTNALGIGDILPFRLDQILWHGTVETAASTTPGYMSLLGNLAIGVLSLSVIASAFGEQSSRARYIARFAAGMGLAMGAAGILAKLLHADQFFVQPDIATLSLAGSTLCLLTSLAILQVLWRRYPISGHRQSLYKIVFKPALATLPLIAIGVVAQLQQNIVQQRLQNNFNKQTTIVQQAIEKNVSIYTNTLIGAEALFGASVSVEPNEWHNYISALNISKNYPGMQSVNFAKVVPKDRLDAVVQKAKADGYTTFTVFPAGTNNTSAIILYSEPPTAYNKSTLGYDMYSNGTRKIALQQAANSGQPVISNAITFLRDDTDKQGFMIALPVYANGKSTQTTKDRQDALEGFVFASLRAQSFFEAALNNVGKTVSITVYDGFSTSSSNILYGAFPQADPKNGITKTDTIYANNHPWTVQYNATDQLSLGATQERMPSIILIGGCTVYLIGLAAFLWTDALRRFGRHPKHHTNHKGTRP